MSQQSKNLKPLTLERKVGESDKAVQACNDWLRLGPGRSLPDLLVKYSEMKQNIAPTQSKATLVSWSSSFDWAERATAYDGQFEERKNATREEVFKEGLALDYERVNSLTRLAADLEAQIYETDTEGRRIRLWVRDVKMIGSGIMATEVELERFNSALLSEFRGTLDDIAKETGGRKSVSKIETEDVTPDERFSRRAARTLELLDIARARRDSSGG